MNGTPLDPGTLASEGFTSVVVTSADVTGRPVGKRFSPRVFDTLSEEGVALSSCVLGWDVDQWPGPNQRYTGNHTGWHDVRLVPDLSTLRPAAWLDRTAICLADFVEGASDDLVEVAPRTILRRQVEALAEDGLTARTASELEFHLYRGSAQEAHAVGHDVLQPTTHARADYTIAAGDRVEGFFAEVREALERSRLEPWTTQVEWGLGQWEINLAHQDPLEMADRHLLFKLALRAVAERHGMVATFMAKPFAATTGSSCHIHISVLDREAAPVFHEADGDRGASDRLKHAVGGVLAHAPDCMLLYAPTANSYRRIAGGEFSGSGLTWGWDNRMVSCRVLTQPPASARLEWRVTGADVDPYLAIAAVLASVRSGLQGRLDPGPPVVGDDMQRPAPLPATLGEAASAFEASTFTKEAFGEAVVAHYAEAGRWEWRSFLAADAVTEWERRRYFDVI